MSDESSDEYHEDSLPDLVLSSAYSRDELHFSDEGIDYSLPPDVVGVAEEPLNLEEEYFASGDQITSSYGSDGVRVSYSDHSKFYLPKISCSDAYRSYLNLTVPSEEDDNSQHIVEEFTSLSLENRQNQLEEWRKELEITQSDIGAMRKEILLKVRKSNILKRQLGITAWREFSTDIQEGWKRVQESEMFQKLELSVSDIGDTIEEFKDVLVKDLEKAKEKASQELATAKQKAASELQSAQSRTSQSLANVQKRASVILRAPEEREYRKQDKIEVQAEES